MKCTKQKCIEEAKVRFDNSWFLETCHGFIGQFWDEQTAKDNIEDYCKYAEEYR